ncbi:hypothetical protein ACQE98_17525 [Ornithinimicrobium sp. W1679]|uniref:hypothetical protein n=1 Tax=Ornithinimicrobium sp. W1679 TaxID=3418770 RepID=UPI003CEC3EB0
MIQLYAKKPRVRKDNPWQPVDQLPDNAGDLLDIIESAVIAVGDDALIDRAKRKYVRITDVSKAKGHPRVLIVSIEVGNYGEHGRTRDVNTHQQTHEHGKEEAPVLDARVVFVVPEKATMALMYSERVHPFSATQAVLSLLHLHWSSQPWASDLALYDEASVNVEAWLESAQVNKIEAVSYGHTSDYETLSKNGKPIGDLTMTLVPPRGGGGHLAKELWHLLRDHPAERAKILGLKEVDNDLDEVSVTVEGANGQRKTFVVDRQKAPSIRIPLSDIESDTEKPNHLVSRCIKESPDIYHNVGVEWHAV